MVKQAKSDNEKRRHVRKKYEAEIYFAHKKRPYAAQIKNISRSGALIFSGGLPKVRTGEGITVTIPFSGQSKSVKREAKVIWVNEILFGIEFA
jgi:hypothetical protein